MTEWKIHRRDERCLQCSRVFEEGEHHFSVLLFGAEGLGREDRCAACFDGGGVRATELVFWRTQRRSSGRRFAIDFDAIERLFQALEGRSEERLAELRYLLCLLLMRKKRLKLVRVRRDEGAELLLVRRPRRTEELLVVVFDLTRERADALRGELERIFEGDLGVELPLSAGEAGSETPASDQGSIEPRSEEVPT